MACGGKRAAAGSASVLDVLEGRGDGHFEDSFIIADVIHGPMSFDPLIKLIVDTPHFQRLRSIKQLGGSYYVYPAADHTRFVHSLGVAHLCYKLCLGLRQKNQPFGQVKFLLFEKS